LTHMRVDQIKLLKSMNWMKQDAADELTDADEVDFWIGKTLVGRYTIDSVVGFGGHGKVYKAFDPELQRHVAIKVSRTVASETQSEQLLEEARRAAKLTHPNIVAVYDVGRHDGQLFFVTELVEGKNLADILADHPPNILEAKRLVISVAQALQYAHQQGFIHRDIKPANILLDNNGRVLVTDFGIATTIDKIEAHRGGTPGTLPYMAPEQIACEIQLIDARTDIHALGVVLYELLTGQLPYQGRTLTAVREQILLRQPKPLTAYNKSVSSQLESICLKCLAKHPADRFETAADVIDALSVKKRSKSIIRIVGLVLTLGIILFSWQTWSEYQRETIWNQTANSDGTFVFTGSERILTPLKRLAPVTLEAWILPTFISDQCHFIIGSDIRGEFGVGLAICGTVLAAETIPKMIKSNAVVPPGKWAHVAAVFTGDETRLYRNGKLIHTGRPTDRVSDETVFVIGNLGDESPVDFFKGKIRSVRISQGERYTVDFEPRWSFVPEKELGDSALLVYDGAYMNGPYRMNGRIIRDLSGNQNDGLWESFSE
jgi:eukaryotic-like serine/threonine-protein kinase